MHYFWQAYDEIAGENNPGACVHVNGGDLTECYKREVNSQNQCRDYCSSQASCVGYDYNIEDKSYCRLFPNDNSCPIGFELYELRNTARAMTDLKRKKWDEMVCFGKKRGKTILQFEACRNDKSHHINM